MFKKSDYVEKFDKGSVVDPKLFYLPYFEYPRKNVL